jgi:SAM-dependent methyltransferase
MTERSPATGEPTIRRPRPASISFDRAAETYDRTRALPPEAMRAVLDVIAPELRARQPSLEIGVGTGRLALPLAARGVRVTGLDLSAAMLAKLVEKSEGRRPVDLVRGDGTRLPFRDEAFGSALAVHVLHLITDWRAAVSELVRAVRPGGAILVDVGGAGDDWWPRLEGAFRSAAGVEIGEGDGPLVADVDRAMRELGASPRELAEIVSVEETTVGERVDRLAAGVYSFTWQVDDATRERAGEQTRAWAREHLGSLTELRPLHRRIVWRAYDR